MEAPNVGRLVDGPAHRDAIHVAVIPMLALRVMLPGEHLANGIVDPFLTAPVQPGERYWLWVTPNTVTSLRHVWTHPAFPAEPVAAEPEPVTVPRPRRSEADVWAELSAAARREGDSV